MTLVADFHEAFGTTDPQVPTPPDRKKAALRLRLIEEEFTEVRFELRALMLSDEVNTPIEDRLKIMARLLKELCDLQYVVQGTADSLGFGTIFDQAYHEVHRANMSKLGADGKPIKRESDGKVLKGPLYRAPDMEQFIDIFEAADEEAEPYADCPALDEDGFCGLNCIGACYHNDGRKFDCA